MIRCLDTASMASLGQASRFWPGRICGNLDEPSEFKLVSHYSWVESWWLGIAWLMCHKKHHALPRPQVWFSWTLEPKSVRASNRDRTHVPQGLCQSTSWRSCEHLCTSLTQNVTCKDQATTCQLRCVDLFQGALWGLLQRTCSQELGFGLWMALVFLVSSARVRAQVLLTHETYRSWGKKTPWLRSAFPQDPKPTNPVAFATMDTSSLESEDKVAMRVLWAWLGGCFIFSTTWRRDSTTSCLFLPRFFDQETLQRLDCDTSKYANHEN